MGKSITIVWFRQDLRTTDNPALQEAVKQGKILPVYIYDTKNAGKYAPGGAAKIWLHHSLRALQDCLNNRLQILAGDPQEVLTNLVKQYSADALYWNRCYEPWRINRDKKIKACFEKLGVTVKSFNASLLWEPWTIQNKQGKPYKVFTPYYRRGCLQASEPRAPLPAPEPIIALPPKSTRSDIDHLGLLPQKADWHKTIEQCWEISPDGACNRLNNFIKNGLKNYKEGRDYPARNHVSRLSPYLHFGLISPHQVWHAIREFAVKNHLESDMDHFCSELGWREFSYHLLYYYPELPRKNFQPKFNAFPWQKDCEKLKAWQQGNTGCPIVDAGMRQLWQTGYMHNRLRMITGSFLVKNLNIHWHEGESWFWDCLVDADLASNSAGWQWIAGCGADAAPYFRIFNPVTQGEKFDSNGEFVRKYVPELQKLPDKYLHCPWQAPSDVLEKADVVLGKDYPELIVDLKASRQEALEAFNSLKPV